MKFLVYRTSDGKYGSRKPCDEVELYKDYEPFGTLWTVEISAIDELVKFCDKYGVVVIIPKANGDPYPAIEIYDDYRE